MKRFAAAAMLLVALAGSAFAATEIQIGSITANDKLKISLRTEGSEQQVALWFTDRYVVNHSLHWWTAAEWREFVRIYSQALAMGNRIGPGVKQDVGEVGMVKVWVANRGNGPTVNIWAKDDFVAHNLLVLDADGCREMNALIGRVNTSVRSWR